jgi:hypothetical protein
VGGDAQQPGPAAGEFDDEQDVEAAQQHGLDIGEVTGQDAFGLGAQELPPALRCSSGSRVDAGPAQDEPDRGRCQPVAEPDQLAVDGESAWGAVAEFPRLRFPRPLSEPDVRLSPHPALHGIHAVGSVIVVGQGDGIFVPRQR